jgi:hypothetical protein
MINKIILFIIGIVVGLLLTTYSCGYLNPNSDFQHTTDSLNAVIANLKQDLVKEDSTIALLNKKDAALAGQVVILAQERDRAKAEAARRAGSPNLTNLDSLHKFFTNRYPVTDRLTLNLPKHSMVEAARDLILCDGTKEELLLADSMILTLNNRIITKDSTISSYQNKDTIYQNIIKTQDTKYIILENEYKIVKQTNDKLKKYIVGTSTWATIMTVLYIFK